MRVLLLITLGAFLASCAATQFTADEFGASYKVRTGAISNNMDEAAKMAAEHCAKFGKKSEFEGINSLGQYEGTTVGTLAKFRCN